MKKRILSLLLAVIMLMSLMSMAALAEEPVTAENAEAVVNGTDYYATLPEAVEAAAAGDTVTLLKDIAISVPEDAHGADGSTHYFYLTIDKKLTIDLNGKTIAWSDELKSKGKDDLCGMAHVIFGVVGNGDLTITGNGTIDCYDGLNDGGMGVWIRNQANAKVTIENGTFYGHAEILYISQAGQIVINGGRFENNTGIGDGHKQLFNVNGYFGFTEGKSITMYGGTIVTCDPRLLNDGNVVAEGYVVSKRAVYSEGFGAKVNEYTVLPYDCNLVASVEATPEDYDYNHPGHGHLPETVTNYYTDLNAAADAVKGSEVVTKLSIDHNYVNDVCTACGAVDPAHVHAYGVVDSKDASCTEDGYIVYGCACGDQYTEVVDAHGHHFSGRYCLECGYKLPLWLYIKMCIEDFFAGIFG